MHIAPKRKLLVAFWEDTLEVRTVIVAGGVAYACHAVLSAAVGTV